MWKQQQIQQQQLFQLYFPQQQKVGRVTKTKVGKTVGRTKVGKTIGKPCSYCKKTGHYLKYCPSKTGGISKCKACYELGHTKRNCSKIPKQDPVVTERDFQVGDVYACANNWAPSTFVQVTKTGPKSTLWGRVLKEIGTKEGESIARQNDFNPNVPEQKFHAGRDRGDFYISIKKVTTNSNHGQASKREVGPDGIVTGYSWSYFMD